MKKIAHLFPWFHANGVAIYVFEVIRNMKNFSHEIITGERPIHYPPMPQHMKNIKIRQLTPFSLSYSPTPFQTRFSLRLRELSEPFLLYLRLQNLRKIAKDYDLIVYHSIDYRLIEVKNLRYFHSYIKKMLKILNDDKHIGTPKLYTDHSLLACDFEGTYVPEISIGIFKNSIIMGRNSIEKAKKWSKQQGYKRNIWHIPNSVDTQKFYWKPLPEKKKLVLGMAGRLGARGDLVFKLLNKKIDFIDLHIAVFGSQGDINDLRKRCGSHVTFYQNIPYDQMPQFYQDIDILLNPLPLQTNDRVIIESMSCGRPVIRVGRLDYFPVIDRANGFVIENNIDSLIQLLSDIHNNRRLIEDLGKNARALIERELSDDVIMPKLEKVYEKVMSTG